MGTQALLVVSFGTSYVETRRRTIDAIEADLAAAFPERTMYTAWTSGFIIKKVKHDTGVAHMNLAEAFAAMAQDGITDVLVQPTHLTAGVEYQLVLDAVAAARQRFENVSVGAPLLVTEDDYQRMAQAINQQFPAVAGQAVVLMGHGAPDGPNYVYGEVESRLHDLGRSDVCIALVEGTPDVQHALDFVREAKPACALLAPMMIVAGDHANNDLAGDDEDSWKSLVEAEGVSATCRLQGFGEYPEVRTLLIEHARAALA